MSRWTPLLALLQARFDVKTSSVASPNDTINVTLASPGFESIEVQVLAANDMAA